MAKYQAKLRDEGRRFQTVTYINSTAAVKALSDWIVTSGNAESIIARVPEDLEILFVPDKHLGSYLQGVTGRPMILWDGSCMVHEVFSVLDLIRLKKRMPAALTLAHPECPSQHPRAERLRRRDRGHAPLRRSARRAHRLPGGDRGEHALAAPDTPSPGIAITRSPGITCACNKCPHMARNTLETLRDCLKTGGPEIHWQPEFARGHRSFSSGAC